MTQNLTFITLVVLVGLTITIGANADTHAQRPLGPPIKHQEQAVAFPVQASL
jgi:hypothetical protein